MHGVHSGEPRALLQVVRGERLPGGGGNAAFVVGHRELWVCRSTTPQRHAGRLSSARRIYETLDRSKLVSQRADVEVAGARASRRADRRAWEVSRADTGPEKNGRRLLPARAPDAAGPALRLALP
jgi:hypothetical protein